MKLNIYRASLRHSDNEGTLPITFAIYTHTFVPTNARGRQTRTSASSLSCVLWQAYRPVDLPGYLNFHLSTVGIFIPELSSSDIISVLRGIFVLSPRALTRCFFPFQISVTWMFCKEIAGVSILGLHNLLSTLSGIWLATCPAGLALNFARFSESDSDLCFASCAQTHRLYFWVFRLDSANDTDPIQFPLGSFSCPPRTWTNSLG